MSINNINLLKTGSNEPLSHKASNEQYIQALANLGQRIGMKGDSIKLSSISFSDIFDNKIDNSEDYFGVITPKIIDNELSCIFNVISSSNLKNRIFDEYDYEDIYQNVDKLTLSENLPFDMIINNVDYVYERSLLKNSYDNLNNLFKTLLFTKVVGTTINSDNNYKHNIDLSYNVFDNDTDKFKYIIRAFHLNTDQQNNDQYVMFEIKEGDKDNKYLLSCWTIILEANNEDLKNSFDTYFTENGLQNYSVTSKYNLFNTIDIDDYENILSSGSDNVLAYIKENGDQILNNIYLNYDTDENVKGFSVDPISESEYNDTLNAYSYFKDKYGITIDDRIKKYLSNDISLIYPRLLEYYSSELFTNDKQSLAKYLFSSILKNLYNDDLDIKIYVPFNYLIKYYSDTSNNINMYISDDIYISFINNLSGITSKIELENIFNTDSNNIIVDYNDTNKISVYKFNSLNSTYFSNIILNILFDKLFTLPYIDKSTGNWKINDVLTDFKSYSYSDSVQSIMIVFNYKDSDGDTQAVILNELPDSIMELLNKDDNWKPSSCIFSTEIFSGTANIQDINTFRLDCKVPKVDDASLYEVFHNMILFVLCDKSLIDNYNYDDTVQSLIDKSDLSDILIASMWKYNEDINEFDYVKNSDLNYSLKDNDYAFDLSQIFNIRSLNARNLLTKYNVFSSIIFENNYDSLKQNLDYINSKFIAFNPSADQYKNEFENQGEISFLNNLMFIIKCKSGVNTDGGYVQDLNTLIGKNTNKFIEIDSNSIIKNSTLTSNSIITNFPYNSTINTNNYTSIETSTERISNKNIIIYDLSLFEAALNSNIIYSNDYDLSYIPEDIINIDYSVTNVTNSNDSDINVQYDEYIFNGDIPTLDLKEVFIANSNSLNRLNILTLEQLGANSKIYNSFIGSPIVSLTDNVLVDLSDKEAQLGLYNGGNNMNAKISNKEILQIKSSPVNINLGNTTLGTSKSFNNLGTQKLLHIKFDNILFESENITNKVKKFEGSTFIGSTYSPDVILKSDWIDYPNIRYSQYSQTPICEHGYAQNDYSNVSIFDSNNDVVKKTSVFMLKKELNPLSILYNYKLRYMNYNNRQNSVYGIFSDILIKAYCSTVTDFSFDDLGDWKDGIIYTIHSKDSSNLYDTDVTYTNLLRELYSPIGSDNIFDTMIFENNNIDLNYCDMKSFFIEMTHFDYSIDNLYKSVDSDVTNVLIDSYLDINTLQNKLKSIPLDPDIHKLENNIYIFRLSDYLYREYGFDITNYDEYEVDEKFSFNSKIFRIALNNYNTGKRYAYFLIYEANELEFKTIDSYNDNASPNEDICYTIVYPKKPITILQRDIYNSNKKILNIIR